MNSLLTKRGALCFSLVVVVLLGGYSLFTPSSLFDSCYNTPWCQNYFINAFNTLVPYLILSLPFIPLSFITFFMREEVFQTWVRFAAWCLPLAMFLTFITPDRSGGGWGLVSISNKAVVLFLTSFAFLVISLFVIGIKYLMLRKK